MSLAPDSYFTAVKKEMRQKGFVLFSQVVSDQASGLHYHVPASVARDTRLFFHYPNKSLIVVLNYDENDYRGSFPEDCEYRKEKVEGHWTITFHFMFISDDEIARLTLIPYEERKFEDLWEVDADFRKVIFRDFNPTPKHFTWRGNGEMCKLSPAQQPKEAKVIADEVWDIAEQALPYIDHLPFSELQVTNFPPHYTFPNSEEAFWELFRASSAKISTARYLWSLVRRPWGSEGLKR